jgi:hypothetical protein
MELNGGVCAWTAGQLKDEAIDSDSLSLKDLKYARAISETSPIVVGLLRGQNEELENVLKLQILKMRNAPLPSREIILHPNLEYSRIHEEVVPRTKNILHLDNSTMKIKRKTMNGKTNRRASGE